MVVSLGELAQNETEPSKFDYLFSSIDRLEYELLLLSSLFRSKQSYSANYLPVVIPVYNAAYEDYCDTFDS